MKTPEPWAPKIVMVDDEDGNPIECIATLDIHNGPPGYPWHVTPRRPGQVNPQVWRQHGDWQLVKELEL